MASIKKIHPTFYGTFVRQMKLLRVIGVDIFQDSNRSFVRKHGRFMFFTSMALFMFVGQILYVLKRKEVGANFLNVVDAIPSILITIQNQVKLSVLVVKKNEIKELILDIGKLWKFDYENMKKNEEMNFWIRRLKIWNDVMFGAMALGIVFFAVMPLAVTIYRCFTENEPEYTFLLNMYFFKGVDSFLTYSIAVAYQAITCSVCQVCLYTPCDYLILNLSFSLAAFLRLVQIDLQSLKGINSNLEHLDFNRADNCEDIKIIVKTHQMLLSLAERLNKIFKEIIFSQVYLSSVIICCYLFTAMFQMSKYGIAPILANLMASFSVFVEIFILALPGQVITDTSSSIADAAYQSPWYKRSCTFRKFLAILIVRSQRPFHLSALGFSDLTLVMFSKVVSTTWSYLSLLNQMTENLDLDM